MTTKQYLINVSELMREWDFDCNHGLDPSLLTIGSNKKASWICYYCGNKWQTSIYHWALNGRGCRRCFPKKRLNFKVENSISITHPEIAKDWDTENNGRLLPTMFSKNSRFEASWRCHICGAANQKSIKQYDGCSSCKKAKKG